MLTNAKNLARSLLVVAAMIALPHLAAAALPMDALEAVLPDTGTAVAHKATGESPICHAHEDGSPFHCFCDGLFSLLCSP